MLCLCAALVLMSLPPTEPPQAPSQDPSAGTDQLSAPGISRELARARVQMLDGVEYDVCLKLASAMEDVVGWVEVRFDLPTDGEAVTEDVILDFAGIGLSNVEVNGADKIELRQGNGHIALPAAALHPGTNRFGARFRTRAAPTGWPLTVYRDPSDGAEYFYTLMVPADAHRLFPCFDQPDLKARLRLVLDVPKQWQAVGNGPVLDDGDGAGAGVPAATDGVAVPYDLDDGLKRWRFATSHPISTYLMAFAAGPFAVTEDTQAGGVGADPAAPLRLLHRQSRAGDLDAVRLFAMHRDGLRWLGEYFAVPYPFDKLDLVLVPGFPYGGMEHAGAIFYRERALVFDAPPTESELTRRSTLIYHELSHQWFGNLVTMEWFDDLWLKEGFATFVAYRCMNILEPGRRSWLRFHQRIKPRAYEVDATTGTTPVFQHLANLADAKSAYGAIVYNKAPAVLRQLEAQLGEDHFRAGMTRFLRRHAFGNARWQDLVTALEEVAETDLDVWSSKWILTPGMPQVQVRWVTDADGLVESAHLDQSGVQGQPAPWPLELELLVWTADGERVTLSLDTDQERAAIPQLVGKPAPRCILLNPGDQAYGQFLVDTRSRDFLLQHVDGESDPLVRAVALSALWDTVREAQMDPIHFAELAARLLGTERDPESHAWLLGRLATCLGRYLDAERAAPLRARVSRDLLEQLRRGMGPLAQQTFRFLARHGVGRGVDDLCLRVAEGQPPAGEGDGEGDGPAANTLPPDLAPGQRDRFLACARHLALGDSTPLLTLQRELEGEDTAKDAYLAEAAAADPATKARYFDSYLNLTEPPEQWMQDSLEFFHWPGQQELTLPYLDRALEQLEWVKEHRKIFFMPAWIDGFVNGHSSPEALAIVDAHLDDESLSGDIRNKLLQSVDGLRRAVRIRKRW